MLDVLEAVLFGVLGLSIVGAGLGVVLANRITTSALLMAFTFLNMAGMFLLLGAETIAMFQILIYVGAKLRANLPVAAAGALGVGFLLAGGLGATARLIFRRGREGETKARLGRFRLVDRD